MALEDAVRSWRQHFASRPSAISADDVLKKRYLPMYRGMGLTTAPELAAQLVADRLVAVNEMTIGHLNERVMEEVCGARKLTDDEKKEWVGIDFRKEHGRRVYLINLKASTRTPNSSIGRDTQRTLLDAVQHEEEVQSLRGPRRDDNPLPATEGGIIGIAGFARGSSGRTETNSDGVRLLRLVGDALWEELGAGPRFTRQLSQEMGREAIDRARWTAEIQSAVERVIRAMTVAECVAPDGSLDWDCLIERFPD